MFADDMVLCGDDETDMTEYLETWMRTLEEKRMRVSIPQKKQFMDFQFRLDTGQERHLVKIVGEELQRVHYFEYLGSSVGAGRRHGNIRVGATWRNRTKCGGVVSTLVSTLTITPNISTNAKSQPQ